MREILICFSLRSWREMYFIEKSRGGHRVKRLLIEFGANFSCADWVGEFIAAVEIGDDFFSQCTSVDVA